MMKTILQPLGQGGVAWSAGSFKVVQGNGCLDNNGQADPYRRQRWRVLIILGKLNYTVSGFLTEFYILGGRNGAAGL